MKKYLFLPFIMINLLSTGCSLCDMCCMDCKNGECDSVDNSCFCNEGFQTDSEGICTIECRTKFLASSNAPATYSGQETSVNGTANYAITLSAGSDITVLNLLHLNNKNISIPLKFERSYSCNLTINDSTSLGNGITLTAFSGELKGADSLFLTYTLKIDSTSTSFIFKGKKN